MFRIQILSIVALLIGSLYMNTDDLGKMDRELYAKAAVLMDARSGRVLYGKNEDEILPMASTTKIMTCLLALEYGNLDEVASVSSYATQMPKVKLNVKKGENYYIKDLLYSLMLESHNDTAVVIAESIGGDIVNFARMMNQKARDIGCERTWFITPNGLDATGVLEDGTEVSHSTTAKDLAKILAYAVTDSKKRNEFLEITRTQSYSFTNVEGTRQFHCSNHNAFLGMMDGALTGKTGFTGNAGYCYVGALENNGNIYVVSLLACGWPNNKNYKWKDTKKLMEYGITHFHYEELNTQRAYNVMPKSVLVENGAGSGIGKEVYVSTYLADEVPEEVLGILLKEDEEIQVTYEGKQRLVAPVVENEVIGTVSYCVGNEIFRKISVLVKDEVYEIDLVWCFQQILDLWKLDKIS